MNTNTGDSEKTLNVYPYGPIPICLPVAEAIKVLGGGNSPVSKASLASYLREDEKSSGLMTKIASAKAYGMIEGRSNFRLTESSNRFFSTSSQARRLALLDFLESPLAFKSLINRFDGTILPPATALATMLSDDTDVPKSWQERVAGFFLRSAKYAGAIDEEGHLRVKASRELRHDVLAETRTAPPIQVQIKAPEIEDEKPIRSSNGGPRTQNSAPRTLSLSETDSQTGETRVVFAEVPADLGLATWQILEQWVKSIRPKEGGVQDFPDRGANTPGG